MFVNFVLFGFCIRGVRACVNIVGYSKKRVASGEHEVVSIQAEIQKPDAHVVAQKALISFEFRQDQ